MRTFIAAISAAAATLSLIAAPGLAQAQRYDDSYYRHHHHHYHHYYDNSCQAGRRHDARVGTVVGAIGGGLIGNAIGHGRVGGTLLGAGAGAVAGHEIAGHNHRC
jgi:hypothetical protein